MSETVLALITDALTEIGVAQAGETLNSDDAALSLRVLNRLVDSLAAEKLAILGLTNRSITLSGAGASYTLGSSSFAAAPTVTGIVDGSSNFNTVGATALKIAIDGEAAVTIALTSGASRTLAQVTGEINSAFVAAGSRTAHALATIYQSKYVRITSGYSDASASISIQSVASNAYAVLGLSVGTTVPSNSSDVTARPIKIKSASTITAAGLSNPVKVVTKEEWDTIPDQTRTGLLIEKAYCDYGYPTATIYVTPKPSAGTLSLTTYEQIAAFSSTDSVVDFPPGYPRALVKLLAVDLAASFQRPVDQSLAILALQSKATIQNLNAEILGGDAVPPPAPAPQGAAR